ncbi:MAG: SGNH/GDSL hydrolase family protein [Dehalococcoidales bacterium]|nr:SGNH/GDSL hydrolase family protein [Dehalococcoidales bacterium]
MFLKIIPKRFTGLNVALAAGLLVNPWLVGYLLLPSNISFQSRIFIGGLDILLITSVLLVYLQGKTPERRKRLVFGFITFILVILVVEAGLQAVSFVTKLDDQQQSGFAQKASLSPYEGIEWAGQYWEEIGEFSLTSVYKPFVGWKYGPYHGEYINVNSEGVRTTWRPGETPGELAETLYVFGGSTVWGYGARDDHTIPSYLYKLLDSSDYDVEVHNYGEWAYTITQETVYLALLLKEGHRPDYVIFYGGANEVYAAYQSGVPDAHYDQLRISEKLGAEPSVPASVSSILNAIPVVLTSYSKIYMVLDKTIQYIFRSSFQEQDLDAVASDYNDEELRLLSAGIAENYLESINFLERLSQSYGFKYAYFQQPTTFTEKKLTDEETATDPRVTDSHHGLLQQMTYASLVGNPPASFFSIMEALGDRTETYYIDFVHISEKGNEVIATKIFEILEKDLLKE